MPGPKPDPGDNRDTYGPISAPKGTRCMRAAREHADAAMGMRAAAHRALVAVGAGRAGSRRKGPSDRGVSWTRAETPAREPGRGAVVRDGQSSETCSEEGERGCTGETILNRLTGAGGHQMLKGWGAGREVKG